jgi:hypothetical protein
MHRNAHVFNVAAVPSPCVFCGQPGPLRYATELFVAQPSSLA